MTKNAQALYYVKGPCLNAEDNTRLLGSAYKRRPERLPAELESKKSKTKKVLKQSFLLTILTFINSCYTVIVNSFVHFVHSEVLFFLILTVIPLNPLSPKSDQRQISPCNINAL